jgi:hypothetical protein
MRRDRKRGRSAPAWSRRQLLTLLAGVAGVVVLLGVGLVLAVVDAASRPGQRTAAADRAVPAPTGGGRSVGGGRDAAAAARDALADRPMMHVDPAAARPGRLSTRNPGASIVLPRSTRTGPVGVPSGFPPTPLGAMAQLAAVDAAAMQSGSLPGARAVITGWAVPGGPTAGSWSGVRALAGFFDAAQLSGGGSAALALVATPMMGLVKGRVGAGFVVPCVDFEVDATLAQTARVAAADCQRIVWVGGRWMVGAGREPAEPPSVWPDTDTAVRAGYRDLRRG